MERGTSLSDLRHNSGSRESLIKTEQPGNPVPYGQRQLKQTEQTKYLMASDEVANDPEVQIHSRAAKATDNMPHFSSGSSQPEKLAIPLQPVSDKPDQQHPISSHPEQEPRKEVVCTEQPSASATKYAGMKSTQTEGVFKIDVKLLIDLLKKIKTRDTLCGDATIYCKVFLHDWRGASSSNSYDIDSDWLPYLEIDLKNINKNDDQWLKNNPEKIALAIQQLLFTVILFQSHYYSEDSEKSRDALQQLEDNVRDIIKYFYLQFGEQWLTNLLNSDTYTRESVITHSPVRPQDFDKVGEILKYHLKSDATKYRPEFLTSLLIATPTETGIQNSFKITEEEITAVKIRHAEISEKKRLEKSFTTHPLKESLELTKVVKGFSNLKNTCFIAAPLIGFIQFYLPYLSPLFQVNEGEELTEATNFDQRITQYVLSIGDLLRQEKFSRMNEIYKEFIELCIDGAKKGWFGGFENFQKQLASKSKKKGEDAASVNRKPPPETPNPTRTGYLQNVFSNFRSVRNEPSTINENTTMMEQEINQLPHKPESITDNKNNSQTNRKPVDFTPKDLAEQDSVEFLCSILQIISRTTYSPELSYYEMFEKTVISDGHELTIVKFNTTGTAPEQTMIYKLPISSEISLKDGFSLQMLLDDVMISKPPVEEQDTSVEPEDFKYTREGQYIGSVPLKKDTKEEGKSTWQITEERTILVAPKAPELIIIQLTLPGNLHERAAIAERLLKDSSQMVSITFRNEDTREDEIQKYEKVCTVFHAEHSPETKMARHFRASIKHPYWDWLLFDDLNAYSIPEDTDVNVDCGAPSMYILRKVTDSR